MEQPQNRKMDLYLAKPLNSLVASPFHKNLKNAKQIQIHSIFSPHAISDSDTKRHWQGALITVLNDEASLYQANPSTSPLQSQETFQEPFCIFSWQVRHHAGTCPMVCSLGLDNEVDRLKKSFGSDSPCLILPYFQKKKKSIPFQVTPEAWRIHSMQSWEGKSCPVTANQAGRWLCQDLSRGPSREGSLIRCMTLSFFSYLFFGPELVKHLLNLMFPVILQAVEGVLGHFKETRLLYGS